MKHLINKENELIPNTFYVFVNLRNNLTRHNFEKNNAICSSAFLQVVNEYDKSIIEEHLGRITMAYTPFNGLTENFVDKYVNGDIDYLPFTLNPNSNINFISFFHKNITNEYSTEYSSEISRRRFFPKFPSRLSSCYAFGDYESCLEANRKYGWDLSSVREFVLVENQYNRVAKVNMEIVSLARYAEGVASLDEQTQQQIWMSYWTGFGNFKMELPTFDGKSDVFESGIMWEYLIEGILKVKE